MNQKSTHNPLIISPGALLIALISLFVPWATYMHLAPWTTPVTLLTYLLGAILLVTAMKSRNRSTDFLVLLFMLYIALVLLSRSWTVVSENWFNAVFWWFICFLNFAGAIRFIKTTKHIRMLVYLSVLGALITGVQLHALTDDWGNTLGRLTVADHNMNFTSYALSGVVTLSLLSTRFIRFPLLVRIALPFSIMLIFYFQIQLGTRGALIASSVVVILHVLRDNIPQFVMRFIPVFAFAFSALFAFGLLEPVSGLIGSYAERDTGDLSGRTVIWAEAVNYISEYPVTGIGPNSFAEIGFSGVGAHNFILVILLETGVFGALLFSIFFFYFFRSLGQTSEPKFGGYLMAIFSSYWFPLAFSGHWETAPFSWIVIATFIRIARLHRDSCRLPA